MSVAKVIEITASSPTSFAEAVKAGIAKAVRDGPRDQGRVGLGGERRRGEQRGDRVPRDDARQLRARLSPGRGGIRPAVPAPAFQGCLPETPVSSGPCYKGQVTPAPTDARLDQPRTSDSTARALVAAIPDPIFRIGTDGVYRGFKVDSERDLLTPPDEVIGRTVHERLPPDVADAVLAAGRRRSRSRPLQQHRVHARRPGRGARTTRAGSSRAGPTSSSSSSGTSPSSAPGARARSASGTSAAPSSARRRASSRSSTRRASCSASTGPSSAQPASPRRSGSATRSGRCSSRRRTSPRAKEDFERLRGDPPGSWSTSTWRPTASSSSSTGPPRSCTTRRAALRYLLCGLDVTARKQVEEEIRRSRARIVSASDAERKRLERNLHDGAQQNLVSVSHAVHLGLRIARTTTRPRGGAPPARARRAQHRPRGAPRARARAPPADPHRAGARRRRSARSPGARRSP